MNVTYDELFPVLVATCKQVITPVQITNIYNYLTNRKDTTTHPAIEGAAKSQHSYSNQNTDIIKDISLNVPGCSELYSTVDTIANNYARALNIHECTIINSWFNIQDKGSTVLKHIHASARTPCTISGVLYINVGEDSSAISFENPNPFTQLFTPGDPEGSRKYLCQSMKQVPVAGTMIVFPSWLSHSVAPSTIDNRVVISFNAA